MKALPHGNTSARDGPNECLRDVIGVDVMHGLHAKVRERERLSGRKQGKDLWIEVSLWVNGVPPRSDEMSGMKQGYRKLISASLGQKKLLDGMLLHPILADWGPRRIFCRWDLAAVAVNPDGSAVKQVLDASFKRMNELLSALRPIAC